MLLLSLLYTLTKVIDHSWLITVLKGCFAVPLTTAYEHSTQKLRQANHSAHKDVMEYKKRYFTEKTKQFIGQWTIIKQPPPL